MQVCGRLKDTTKLWSFRIRFVADIRSRLLATGTYRTSGCRLCSDYSNTKNVNDGQYSWAAVSELLTVFGDSIENAEPRRLDEVVLRIASWLNCSYDKAVQVLLSKPHLRSCHLESMDTYVAFLEKNGVSADLLCENPWLLDSQNTITIMRYKFYLVSRILCGEPLNVNNVKLLYNGYQVLKKLERHGNICFEKRIDFLCESLGEPRAVISEILNNRQGHSSLLVMDYDRLVRTMNLLLEAGISPKTIRNDLLVFSSKESMIRSRLATVKEFGVQPLKPWIVRCSESNFQVFLHRNRMALRIAGGDTKEHRLQYLSRRLDGYDTEDVVIRHPGIRNYSVIKMKASFDYLYNVGVTAEEIYEFPFVIGMSIRNLDSKFKLMESYELTERLPLHVFYISFEKFKRRLKQMSTKRKVDLT